MRALTYPDDSRSLTETIGSGPMKGIAVDPGTAENCRKVAEDIKKIESEHDAGLVAVTAPSSVILCSERLWSNYSIGEWTPDRQAEWCLSNGIFPRVLYVCKYDENFEPANEWFVGAMIDWLSDYYEYDKTETDGGYILYVKSFHK